jgi:golgi integral membrane protein 4
LTKLFWRRVEDNLLSRADVYCFLIFISVVVEQKLRLENSLLSERKLYQETKEELQKNLENQQKINEEQVLDSNLRFSSLQQHFKLTKSQLDDLTADCAKTRETQMEESNSQNLKIKSLQSQLIQANREKEKEIEIWKVNSIFFLTITRNLSFLYF